MASGESKGSRRYDKENLLWQSTVAIRSDPVGFESDPVQLHVVFESPSGAVVGMESLTVRLSSKKGIKIPEGSARARFTALKARREDAPEILFFAPSASVK
jgi:hypothetical protein